MSLHTSTETRADTFATDWQHWHANHEHLRSDPHGFLAVTELHWLGTEATALAGAPGTWRVEDDVVRVALGEGDSLRRDGVELNTGTGELAFGPIAERDGFNLGYGETVLELAKRGGEYILRPRDPANALLRNYQGTPAYAPDEGFAVPARYEPFRQPRETTVGAAVEGIHHVYQAPGQLRFRLGGQEQSLTVFNGHAPGTFTVLFTDATSGVTTYAANRSLTFSAPETGGPVVLDFNRAVNLPCAYTDLATCPLPPAENHLTVAVEAGEKTPLEREGSL
ncbi:hypothetical protein AL755_14735 [Arthrobacter sp. ERGS1:01]|uniref:DUF1684 domain-containing protein n=1 Tax=Arthrobacter sp. ERGS1:01 TaxID=1704044 RepID=UPI0006B66F1F|nr:DUF1684 domain-containing protein [Arthrobacter sp. ERGS1:01]ALE06427.1 hypothetical protein AL755_14735 [Arthrobacter sp. ERGS1:01]